MDDTIYRRDAIDVARKCRVIKVTPAHMLIDKAEVMTELMMLPSAQSVDKDINVPDNDPISRQGVLRLLNAVPSEEFATKAMLISGVKALPPAQPRWIPDSKPPTENGPYLVWMPFAPEGHHITVTEWCGSYWNIKTPITAWARLPEP